MICHCGGGFYSNKCRDSNCSLGFRDCANKLVRCCSALQVTWKFVIHFVFDETSTTHPVLRNDGNGDESMTSFSLVEIKIIVTQMYICIFFLWYADPSFNVFIAWLG